MHKLSRIPIIGQVMAKLPPWAIVLLLIAVSAGVGAAPVIGGVTGEANTVVEQAVTVHDGRVRLLDAEGVVATGPSPSAAFVLNTEGTGFIAAISLATGDQYAIDLALANTSLDQAAMELTFESEAEGFTATAALLCGAIECAGVQTTEQVTAVAHSGPNTFIVQIEADSDGQDAGASLFELRISVKIDDTIAPGFYKTSLNLTQIDN